MPDAYSEIVKTRLDTIHERANMPQMLKHETVSLACRFTRSGRLPALAWINPITFLGAPALRSFPRLSDDEFHKQLKAQ
jgi:hypothetical protein